MFDAKFKCTFHISCWVIKKPVLLTLLRSAGLASWPSAATSAAGNNLITGGEQETHGLQWVALTKPSVEFTVYKSVYGKGTHYIHRNISNNGIILPLPVLLLIKDKNYNKKFFLYIILIMYIPRSS